MHRPALVPALVPTHLRPRLLLAAGTVFGLGLLVYLVAREGTRIGPDSWFLAAHQHGLLRMASDSLPSLAHAYAFTMAGCVWLVTDWRGAIRLGLLLWGLEAAFEVLQHAPLHEALHSPPLVRRLLANRFDPQDLVAAALGVAGAWATVCATLATNRHGAHGEPTQHPRP